MTSPNPTNRVREPFDVKLDHARMKRLLAENRANKAPTLADDVQRIDPTVYMDELRWNAEVKEIFLKLPIVVCLTSQLKEAGSFVTFEAVSTPLLAVRGKDGVARVFLNSCSHRGAPVSVERCGIAKRLTCPYHAWTYDLNGSLIAITEQHTFGNVRKEQLGLVELPSEEAGGFVWAILTPGLKID